VTEKESVENLFKQHITPHLREIDSLMRKPAWRTVIHPWLRGLRETRVNGLIHTLDNQKRDVWAGQIQIIDQILGLRGICEKLLRDEKSPAETPDPADWEQGLDDSTGLNPNADLDEFA